MLIASRFWGMFFGLVVLAGRSTAQVPAASGWQLETGLQGQQVQDFVQEPGQLMWLATDGGVFRYDGPGRLIPLAALQRGGAALPPGACYQLLLTPDRQLWFGTALGVFRFGLSDGVLRSVPLPEPAQSLRAIKALALDADGRHVWVGQAQTGLRRYTLAGVPTGSLVPVTGPLREAWPAPDGSLWVSLEWGETRRYRRDGSVAGRWLHPLRDLWPVAEPHTGRVWLLSAERLYRPDARGHLTPGPAWRLRRPRRQSMGRGPVADRLGPWAAQHPELGFSLTRQDTTVVAFVADEVVQLGWTGAASGAAPAWPCLQRRFAVAAPTPADTPGGLAADNTELARIRLDVSGRWWAFHTGHRGAWTRAATPALVQPLAGPGGYPYSVRAVTRLPDGRLLASAYEVGLLVQAADSPLAPLRPWGYAGPGTRTGLIATLMGVVPAAAGPRRREWLAAGDHDFLTLDPRTGYLTTLRPRPTAVRAIDLPMPLALTSEPGDGGRVWSAASSGLYCYDAQAADFVPYRPPTSQPLGRPPLAGQVLEDVQADEAGHLWLATSEGVLRLTVATGEQQLFGSAVPAGPRRAPLRGVRCLLLDRAAERLWVGSRTEGLGLIDLRTGQARQVLSTANGLPHAHVASLVASSDGALWLGTYAGLVRYDPRNGALAVFTTADGLRSDECNARAAYADARTGTLLVGGVAGLHRVYPDRGAAARTRPRLLLTAYTPLDAAASAASSPTRYLLAADRRPSLELGPGHPVVDLHLALTDYADAGQARYAYRIGGWLDGRWLPLGAVPLLRLQGLPPGRYDVEIRGETAQGVAAVNTLRLLLTVTAEWYRQPWVWAAAAALAVGAVFGWQHRRLRRQRQDYERRARLAADLHDEVGALLTRVTMQAELLRELEHAPPARLDALVRDSRAAASTVRDIIWSVDVAADSLQALVDRLRDLLDQTARATGRTVRFEGRTLPTELDQPLPSAVRQHVYLVAKEAVTNALRHAAPDAALEVALGFDATTLTLAVRNDGPAVSVSGRNSGQGLRNMRERARQLGAALAAGPRAEGGWEVTLRVNIV